MARFYRIPMAGLLLAWSLASCGEPLRSPDEEIERGNTHMDAGDLEWAIQAYTAAIEKDPRSAKAYNNRGLALAAEKDYATAIADYDVSLSLDAHLSEGYYNRGVARFRQGEKSKAVIDFTEAIKLNPQYIRAYAARGLVYKSAGDVRSALSDFRNALELAPPDWADRKAIEAEMAQLFEPRK